jgi:GNAT superfamily N-acetyltransferase
MRHAGVVIEVRAARVEDTEAIASAHVDGWRVGYRDILPVEYLDADEFAAVRRERWRAWVPGAGEDRVFVVSMQGRIVGFGHVGPERVDPVCDQSGADLDVATQNDGRGELYALYLHPTAWGSGSAGALMSRCEEFLRDRGYHSAVLWVLRDNPRARAFYEKSGWINSGLESTFAPGDPPIFSVQEVQYTIHL